MIRRRTVSTLVPAVAFLSAASAIAPASGNEVRLQQILSIEASRSQLMVQQTPIDTLDGYVYTANIEPGRNGDSNDTTLRTVLHQGKRQADGSFEWRSIGLDDRTMADRYHTAPAVGIDRAGHVHVAYNMHNTPWQYKRSEAAHDIGSLEFRGQDLTTADIDRVFYANKASFPTLGKATIPGNHVTYPAFFRDRTGELHVSYRFAARPARSFSQRTMSGGVARYDLASQTWSAIGGEESLTAGDFRSDNDAANGSTSVAGTKGWTVYHPDLAFDQANRMHLQFFWREGTAGPSLTRPCHVVVQADGRFVGPRGRVHNPPLRPYHCGNMGFSNSQQFSTLASFRTSNAGVPHALLSPQGKKRQLLRLEGDRWVREDAPYNATEIFFDENDTLYAVVSGLRILRRPAGSSDWELVYSKAGGGDCYPRAVVDEDGANVYIHTHSCDGTRVRVYAMAL